MEMSTFFTVSVSDVEYSTENIFHSDILVTNQSSSSNRPQQFTIAFLISFTSYRRSVAQIEVVIHHCKNVLHKQLLFLKMKKKSPSKVDLTEAENPKDISNFLLAFFLSILSVCFLYFLLLALQAIRRSSRVPQAILPTKKRKSKETLNYIFLFKATLYLTFKLFYTVTFTLSLVLSVCLSLNSISTYSSSTTLPELSKDATKVPPKSNYTKEPCVDLKVRTERNFLKEIKNILINDEHIRTNSSQSTQKLLLNMIKHNQINGTRIYFDSEVRPMGRDIDDRLRNVLGHYVRIYDQMSNLKWLSTFNSWNNSVTTVDILAEYKDRYLNLFNLLKIYSATSIMENNNIFSQRISNFRHRLKFAINATTTVKSPLLSLPKGLHQRYFINLANYEAIFKLQKQESIVYKETKNRNISSLNMVKVRVIFMFIDTVLIIYRFYWTFINIQNMWKSKKEIVQLNQIKMKDCQNIYSECAKRSTLQWTKEHHLECLTSGHIVIATTIIVVSIICTNLIVLLTSKDHAYWLSKISGNIVRVRSLKIMKERLSQFNTINVMPVQRHWEYLKTIKLKEIMTFRILSTKKMMNLELFFNKCYFYELCHFQKMVSLSPRAIDFCSSVMPHQIIIPEKICGGPYNSPWPLSYNLTGFFYSKTMHYWNLVIHFSVHVLAIVILIVAFVGILKMFRKQIGNTILSSGHSTYAVYVTQDQYLANFKSSLQMGIGMELSSIYNRSLNPHQHYQCWKNNPPKKNDTPF